MTQRRHEIEAFANVFGEPSNALFRSALLCQDRGDLEAAARIAADQALKRPRMRWASFLLALEAVELRLAGSVKLSTPTKEDVWNTYGDFREEHWGELELVTFPEGVHVFVSFDEDLRGIVLRGRWKEAMHYDKLVREGLKALAFELAAHLGVVVTLAK